MRNLCCPCCQGVRLQDIVTGRDRLLDLPISASLVCCVDCGTFFQNPQLNSSELAAHYPPEYHPFAGTPRKPTKGISRWIAMSGLHQRVRHLHNVRKTPGTLLDLGCATGTFMRYVQNIGWQTVGVETSAHASEIARTENGLDVRTGELIGGMFPSNYFDVVTLWDVLEHVPDPVQTLSTVAEYMKPGGWLIVRVPNPESIERRWFATNWSGWDIPRHLTVFTYQSLVRTLNSVGLAVRFRSGSSGQFAMWALSVKYAASENKPVYSLFVRLFRGRMRFVTQIVLSPMFWFFNVLSLGSVMTIAAQKPITAVHQS